ncbi:hypothetical protein pEaSNUABM29_00166 [Erwinia phage pEa_SNUABM_29]|nr:hypothetical protein pEaSNUABM29_00166 [Erwinia phage pEa_SNUABM_29]
MQGLKKRLSMARSISYSHNTTHSCKKIPGRGTMSKSQGRGVHTAVAPQVGAWWNYRSLSWNKITSQALVDLSEFRTWEVTTESTACGHRRVV